ncbi:MAG: (S)-ureidoglycine aminohydrolase [Solirubrobacteraceae bacterium]
MTGPRDCFVSRGATAAGYHLITPKNRAVSGLPELAATVVVKLVTPRRAPAAFAQYLLELAPGGGTATAPAAIDRRLEHAFYGLDGAAVLVAGATTHVLGPGRFAYLPPGNVVELDNPAGAGQARVLWFARAYEPVAGLTPPPPCFGDRDGIDEPEYSPGLFRTVLFGDDPGNDFVLIRMRFEPGVDLAMTELHEEEHGLYMTAGSGSYLLGADIHDVHAGDFIYMAPYCPQSFVADPVQGAEYLLYKDANRSGFRAGLPQSPGEA